MLKKVQKKSPESMDKSIYFFLTPAEMCINN